MKRAIFGILWLMVMAIAFVLPAGAETIKLSDPVGDDKGPGTYIYPTNPAYAPGSFDLTELAVTSDGDEVSFDLSVKADLKDPWGMGTGFAVQMVFIFIDTDPSGGHKTGLPGLNIQFKSKDAWEKVVILSPQGKKRVLSEAKAKASDLVADIVVPDETRGAGRTISGRVKLAAIGGTSPSQWGYQVVMQSNEGYPAKEDLLVRRVNEFEGQHRFGGGNDGSCDPHVIDILAGAGQADPSEVDAQFKMLAYECDDQGYATKKVRLTMVRPSK